LIFDSIILFLKTINQVWNKDVLGGSLLQKLVWRRWHTLQNCLTMGVGSIQKVVATYV